LKDIQIKNKQILQYLDEFVLADCVEDLYSSPKGWDGSDYEKFKTYATCDETLYEILKNKDAYKKLSYNKIFGETKGGICFKETVGKKLNIQHYYTSAYVPKGFVGWHSDNDVSGHYLMFTYSSYGKGFFKYRDPKTGNIYTLHDTAGWMLKVGSMGSTEHEIVWHCAASDDERYTFIFVYNDLNTFDKCLEIIDNETY